MLMNISKVNCRKDIFEMLKNDNMVIAEVTHKGLDSSIVSLTLKTQTVLVPVCLQMKFEK